MLNTEPCPLRTQFGFGEPFEMGLTDLRIPAEEIETEERVKRVYIYIIIYLAPMQLSTEGQHKQFQETTIDRTCLKNSFLA